MKCGIVVFPGSNCDHDVYHVWKHVLQQDPTFRWAPGRDALGATWWCCRAASPTATTCGPAPWRRCRR